MSKTQNQRVLDHMIDHGYITQTIAGNYGIRRLASRIHDLTKEGVTITRTTKTDDAAVRYASYSLKYVQIELNIRAQGAGYKLASQPVKRYELLQRAA
jgi:hypothetical protein